MPPSSGGGTATRVGALSRLTKPLLCSTRCRPWASRRTPRPSRRWRVAGPARRRSPCASPSPPSRALGRAPRTSGCVEQIQKLICIRFCKCFAFFCRQAWVFSLMFTEVVSALYYFFLHWFSTIADSFVPGIFQLKCLRFQEVSPKDGMLQMQ